MLLEDIQVTSRGKFISTNIFPLLPDGKSPKRIYVRQCYEDVLERVILAKLGTKKFFWISGTKGIGKSTLGLFLLYYFFVKANVPVLYKSAKSNVLICDPEKGMAFWFGPLDSPQLSLYYENPKAIVIADNVHFVYDTPCTKVFISSIKDTVTTNSPLALLLKELQNSDKVSITVPPWTLAEIETCAADFDVTPDAARDRYSQFGGIPRYVLSQTGYEFSQILNNLGSIIELWSQLQDQFVSTSLPSYILHYFPVLEESSRLIDYSKFTVDFGSKFIATEVIKKLEKSAIQTARNFILSTETRNGAATFRGSLFEGLVVMDFQKVDQEMKSCLADSKDKVTIDLLIKKKKRVEMRRAQDINLVANEFYYDDRDNFESIDAAFLMSIEEKSQLGLTQSDQYVALLQITIAKKHDVKRKGLAEVIEHCKKIIANAKFILVFVLSEAAAPNFGLQKIVNKDDSETVKHFNIPQYIWRVPICLESI